MANSGIFYNVREVPGQPIYYASPEVQVLDNVDATDNKIASHLAGSLYDMLPADPKTVHPAGEWNTIVISVKNGKVAHIQNGVKVVEYELWTPAWDEMVEKQQIQNLSRFYRRNFKRRFNWSTGSWVYCLVQKYQDQRNKIIHFKIFETRAITIRVFYLEETLCLNNCFT